MIRINLPPGACIVCHKEAIPKILSGQLEAWSVGVFAFAPEGPDSEYFKVMDLPYLDMPESEALLALGQGFVKQLEQKAAAASAQAYNMIANYKSGLLRLEAPTVAEASDD